MSIIQKTHIELFFFFNNYIFRVIYIPHLYDIRNKTLKIKKSSSLYFQKHAWVNSLYYKTTRKKPICMTKPLSLYFVISIFSCKITLLHIFPSLYYNFSPF